MPQLRKKLTKPAPAVRFLKVDVGTEFESQGHQYRVTQITEHDVTAELVSGAGLPLCLPRVNIETPKDAMTQLSGMLPVNTLPMKKTGKKKKR